jgi:hypothetical protein
MAKNQTAYNKERYKLTKEFRKQEIRDRQKAIRDVVQKYKIEHGCFMCGYKRSPRALTFHHIGDDKKHDVARMCAQGRSLKAIFEEIEKCHCVCMNCHMEIHEQEEGSRPKKEYVSLGRPVSTKNMPL